MAFARRPHPELQIFSVELVSTFVGPLPIIDQRYGFEQVDDQVVEI